MCGILGYFGRDVREFNGISKLQRLTHRGPDNSGYLEGSDFFLGHTRLSIVDVSNNGNQPMTSSDGRFVLVYNGEIYNHIELRNRFLQSYEFKSSSDTETLLYGLMDYGEDFLKEVNGIFAFAFLDKITGDFLVVRDQFGVKPMYYIHRDDHLFFSSEVKAIIDDVGKVEHNDFALQSYITYLWCPGEETPLCGIKKLLPGNLIRGNLNSVKHAKISEYYHLLFPINLPSSPESFLISELNQFLLKAVKRQLMSDVPVGFFLSGGLDSSLIVALACKIYPERTFKCYTIIPADNSEGFENDLYYARKVAQYLNVELVEVAGDQSILEDFEDVIYYLDEPQADPAATHVYNICKRARQDGIKVLIGGTGGDDLFSGYRRHQALKWNWLIDNSPLMFRKLLRKVVLMLPGHNPMLRRAKKVFQNVDLNKEDRLIGYFNWLDPHKVQELFKLKTTSHTHNYFKRLISRQNKEIGDLNTMLNLEIKSFLVDHNLNYTDKLGMASGVEVRVPFLDKDLVEFTTRIPEGLKLKNNETKYILKKVAEEYLPKEVVYRSKSGFGAPVRDWIINFMDSHINEYLSSDSIEKRGIFDYKKVKELIDDNRNGKLDASYSIWALMSIEVWFRKFTKN